MIRWILGGVFLIAGLLVCLTFFLQPNSFIGCGDTPNNSGNCRKADAIVALSGGDTNARADEAIKLYKNGWADLLIFSGAAQDKSGPSNAEAMAERARVAGVPTGAIELDETAIDTSESAVNTQSIFETHHLHTIILVTSGYHQRRASLEFDKRSGDAIILNHPVNDKDWNMWWWLTPRGWWLAGSEVVKIIFFYVQGAVS